MLCWHDCHLVHNPTVFSVMLVFHQNATSVTLLRMWQQLSRRFFHVQKSTGSSLCSSPCVSIKSLVSVLEQDTEPPHTRSLADALEKIVSLMNKIPIWPEIKHGRMLSMDISFLQNQQLNMWLHTNECFKVNVNGQKLWLDWKQEVTVEFSFWFKITKKLVRLQNFKCLTLCILSF